MVVADYPFCIYCDNEVYDVKVEEPLVIYRCVYCEHEVGIVYERLL